MGRMVTAAVPPQGLTVDPERLAEVCERYGVEELAVFGSVARGEASADSDVDLLYVLAPGARLGFADSPWPVRSGLFDSFGSPASPSFKDLLVFLRPGRRS